MGRQRCRMGVQGCPRHRFRGERLRVSSVRPTTHQRRGGLDRPAVSGLSRRTTIRKGQRRILRAVQVLHRRHAGGDRLGRSGSRQRCGTCRRRLEPARHCRGRCPAGGRLRTAQPPRTEDEPAPLAAKPDPFRDARLAAPAGRRRVSRLLASRLRAGSPRPAGPHLRSAERRHGRRSGCH